jgi:hypothetical protein
MEWVVRLVGVVEVSDCLVEIVGVDVACLGLGNPVQCAAM